MITEQAKVHLSAVDPIMAELISRCPIGVEQREREDVFQSLCRAIIYQQLSGKAAAAIERKFLALFDHTFPLVPVLANAPVEQLRTAGLSGQKANYLGNIARFWQEQELHQFDWDKRSDDELIALLTQIKGVGKWTVEMLLIFTLQRPDVFPNADLGIKKSIARHYKSMKEDDIMSRSFAQKMQTLSETWKPYRSTATRYLWRAIDGDIPSF